jgi:hypothetical protein
VSADRPRSAGLGVVADEAGRLSPRRWRVGSISRETLRRTLHGGRVSWQRMKTWKTATDPDYDRKKARVLDLYGPTGRRVGDLCRRVRPAEPAAMGRPGPAGGGAGWSGNELGRTGTPGPAPS